MSSRAAPRPRLAERALLVTIYVNAIFWSIPVVRPLSTALRRAGAPRWSLGGAGVAFAALVLLAALRRARAGAVVFALAVYAGLVLYLRAIPDEVVHLVEYGTLGLIVRWALGPSDRTAVPGKTIVLTSAIGFLDEWTQGATPGRFFDWRDVIVNTVAAAVPILLFSRKEKS